MGRPFSPESQFHVGIHRNGGRCYASTQPYRIDPESGKKKHYRIHWGIITSENVFIPGNRYLNASEEERSKLIFPDNWNLTKINDVKNQKNECDATKNNNKLIDIILLEAESRLYGDIWFLEQIADITGIREDLMKVFANNIDLVNKILTLAYFLFSGYPRYSQISNWQKIAKVPCKYNLCPYVVTRITQSITEQNRIDFLSCRANRIHENELCAVDSTTRSAYGNNLAEIKFGKNKENTPLPQTLEIVVYTLSTHQPIYYKTLQGNIPDGRTIDIILYELIASGFKDIVLITDRGYDYINNLDKYIFLDQKVIMKNKINLKYIKDVILSFGQFSYSPSEMKLSKELKIYYIQKDLQYTARDSYGNEKKANLLKLNIYFNPITRAEQFLEINATCEEQKEALSSLQENNIVIEDISRITNDNYYYTIEFESVKILKSYKNKNSNKKYINHDLEIIIKNKKIIDNIQDFQEKFSEYDLNFNDKTYKVKDFKKNEKKFLDKILLSGFSAITTCNINMDPVTVYKNYQLRDEQEKYFFMMKGLLSSDRQRNSSQSGKEGRLFILFIAQIIGCYISNIRKNKLNKNFKSISDILNEMRAIKYIEHPNASKQIISPFVGKQIEICEAFNLTIPEGCSPDYILKMKGDLKRSNYIHAT